MRLPEDILATIFRLVRASRMRKPRDSLGLEVGRYHSLRWTAVMRVCHAWRKVAIACPHLWTFLHVCNTKEDKTAKTLQNSCNLPLTVQVTKDKRHPILDILNQMHRLRTLRLVTKLEAEEEALLATKQAPLLESYELHGTLNVGTTTEPSSLPLLFAGVHPLLSSLAFCGFTRYGNNDFALLRRLCMGHQTFRVADDFTALLNFLEGLPQLEDLMFYSTLPVDAESLDLNPTKRLVSLPHLRRAIFAVVGISFAGLLLCSIHLPETQPLAVIYTPLSAGQWQRKHAEVDTAIAARLHLLSPFWDQLEDTADRMEIDTKDRRWSVTIASKQRELRLLDFSATANNIHAAFGVVVARIQDIWIHIRAQYSTDPSMEDTIRTLFRQADMAKRVYIELEEKAEYPYRKWGILNLRDKLDPIPRLTKAEEWHLNVHTSDGNRSGDGDIEDMKKFFKRLERLTGGAFHIYSPKSGHYVLDEKSWKQAFEAAADTVSQKVVEHRGTRFPGIPLSRACTSPCHFGWDLSGMRSMFFGSDLNYSDSELDGE